MAPISGWVPMRWASGPLEVSIRQKTKGFNAGLKETLERWHQPDTLEFLKGSPINCLVLSWAGGIPEDATQQKSLTPLLEAGRRSGLSFAGLITGRADKSAAIEAARSTGLDAVVVEGEVPKNTLPVIPFGEITALPWGSSPPAIALQGCRWPGVQVEGEARESSDVNASATQQAWIDSNIFLVQLARAYAPEIPIWLGFDPPDDRIVTTEAYLRAVADAGAAGAQWAVSLDINLRSGLAARAPEALKTWQEIAAALEFFSKHRDWALCRPKAVLGVLSDFSGTDWILGEEILNLLARRNLPFQVIPKPAAAKANFTGLKAIVCFDENPPAGALRQQLLEFVKLGGLLMASRKWGAAGTRGSLAEHAHYDIFALDKGRLAISKEESPDPYLVARDAHVLLGRTNDMLRFYNISTAISRLATANDRWKDVLQFVNFARRDPRDPITVWLGTPHKAANLWTLGEEESATVQTAPELGGVAVHLPSIATYAAVELS